MQPSVAAGENAAVYIFCGGEGFARCGNGLHTLAHLVTEIVPNGFGSSSTQRLAGPRK